MVAQLLAALPTHEPAAFAPPQKAQLLLDELMRVGGADDADTLHVGAQPSAFLLAAELVHAHHAQLTAQLPQLLVLATVHFGSTAEHESMRIGREMLARLLAVLTNLTEEARSPLEEPPATPQGRAALVAALGAGAGGAALTAAWGAACLAWAMGARDSRVRVAALEWYEAIVLASPDGLPYDDAHRVALLVAACQAQGEAAVVAAALNLLCSYATAAPAVPYATATLLACVAVPSLSSPLVKQFALSQSILRSLLERRLQPDDLLLVTEEAAAAAPPMSVLPAAPDTSGWKSQLLLPALSAQIVAYGGAAPSADEVLRGLLLRGGPLAECHENTVWLLSALRELYAPHFPTCDQLSLSLLWTLLLRACTSPREPDSDAAAAFADSWLAARGHGFENLRNCFLALHSSRAAERDVAAVGLKGESREAADWWLAPLSAFVQELRAVFQDPDEQQRCFDVLLQASCQGLQLSEEAADEEETEESSAGGAQKWASLCMLDALLAEFRGHWQREQHTATAQLLSSWVFSLDDDHAAKLRVCMQRLAADPPADADLSCLKFIQLGAAPGAGDRARAVSEAQLIAGEKAFVESIHLPLIPEGVWLDALTSEALRLAPPSAEAPLPPLPAPDPGAVVLPDQAGAATVSKAAPASGGGAGTYGRGRAISTSLPAAMPPPPPGVHRMSGDVLPPPSIGGAIPPPIIGGAPAAAAPAAAPPQLPIPPQLAGRGISVAAVAPPALPPVPGLGGLGGIAPPVIASQMKAPPTLGGAPPGMPPLPGARPLPGLPALPPVPAVGGAPPGMPPLPLPGMAGARPVVPPPMIGGAGGAAPPQLPGAPPARPGAAPPPMLSKGSSSAPPGARVVSECI